MSTDEPKFVQAAPDASKVAAGSAIEEEKLPAQSSLLGRSGWGRALREDEVDEDADSFLCWLVRYPVERNHPRPPTGAISVKKSGDAVVCMPTDKLTDVLQKLVVEGFLSMPVLSTADSRLCGYIDLLDIVWFTLWSFGAWREESSSSTEQIFESREHFSTFLTLERFRNATVLDVMGRPGFGTRSIAQHVYKGFSLWHVFELMARVSTHRVAICNSERKVTGLITQSMVISLLDQHMDRLGSLATNHTVQELIPGLYDELKQIDETATALQAFKMMVQHNVSGLAVVNKAGELLDSISTRDLRGMGVTADDWTSLWMEVGAFKAHCREKFKAQTPQKPIYVTKLMNLETVIKLMDDGNIHRVFVCEEKEGGKLIPSHVISQRDVLRFLLHLSGLKSTSLEDLERAAEVM